MAMAFTRHLECDLCVYDNMDELSLFRGASQEMIDLETELLPARRRRLYRRHEPLRGEARPAPQRARLPVRRSTSTISRRRARTAIPTRRTRRRSRIRGSASSASSTSGWIVDLVAAVADAAAGLAAGHGRAGGEDRPGDPAAARPTSTGSAARATTICRATLRAGTPRLMPFALQRVDALHQPDEDARVPRRRRAGGLDADHRRRAPLRREGTACEIAATPLEFVAKAERAARSVRGGAWLARGRSRTSQPSSWDQTWAAMHRADARRPEAAERRTRPRRCLPAQASLRQ